MFKNCYVRLYYFNFLISKLRLSSRLNKSLLNCRNNSSRKSHLASKILTVCPSEFDLCWSISEKFRSLKLNNIFFIIYKMAALPQWQFFLPPMQSMSKITKMNSVLVTTWKFEQFNKSFRTVFFQTDDAAQDMSNYLKYGLFKIVWEANYK